MDTVPGKLGDPSPVELVRDPERLAAMLPEHRSRMLRELRDPDSAAGLARRIGMSRQQVNYHLRELERAGLVELVEERRRGNCVERVLRATARSYVVSPEALGVLGQQPTGVRDRFSSAYLVAVAARTIGDLAELRSRADAAGQRLPTMTLEAEVRFGSAADRNAFARELTDALSRLIVKYHDSQAEGGRSFRVHLGAYPKLEEPTEGPSMTGDVS